MVPSLRRAPVVTRERLGSVPNDVPGWRVSVLPGADVAGSSTTQSHRPAHPVPSDEPQATASNRGGKGSLECSVGLVATSDEPLDYSDAHSMSDERADRDDEIAERQMRRER